MWKETRSPPRAATGSRDEAYKPLRWMAVWHHSSDKLIRRLAAAANMNPTNTRLAITDTARHTVKASPTLSILSIAECATRVEQDEACYLSCRGMRWHGLAERIGYSLTTVAHAQAFWSCRAAAFRAAKAAWRA